ncbi:MAG TPA: ABC transporter ATP-binding protein [Candidatus Deferrimicrobium sp.]|nr:ABC transporter ATP-binding protein [Candidatus Deferrimicrobium sp.]
MLKKYLWLWRYYRQYPYVLAVLLIMTPVQTAIAIMVPRLIQFAIDYGQTGEVTSTPAAVWLFFLGKWLGITAATGITVTLIGVGLLSAVLYAYVQSHRAWMNQRLEWAFRQETFNGITLKGPDFFNRFRTGDLVTRMTDDVADKLSWFACSGIFRMYEALLFVTFAVAMMVTIDPWLTLWSTGPLPILILVFFKSSSLLDRRYEHLQGRISALNDVMEACYSGIRVVKAYVKEKAQQAKFDHVLKERRLAEISSVRVGAVIDSLYMYIWQIGVVVVLVAGGYMVVRADLSLGKLVAFIFYVVYLVFPMFSIGQFLVKSRQSAVSIDRLAALAAVPPMVSDTDGAGNGSIRGDIAFESVEFTFPGSDRKIIDGVSLTVAAGQTVALVGKVGAGKTWLINLIPRLVDPTGGGIRIDGRDLREFRLADLRRSIGYVPQEPVLFSDTVRNNILFGRAEIDDAVLKWAIDVSQLTDEIASFPAGLDTPIGTHGVAISGGQKQRLALARALVGKPKILILDDCTSALDSRTEAALWHRLEQVMPGLTAIMITHRPDALERADAIYVLDEGRIVESGTHHELMERSGHYSRIYRRYRLEQAVTTTG